mmetsp:Transcript_41062/g.66050  ORF Transcript_41062/g.66050 Transcript_41062/m.66050 type:complete len:112 (+) Transcript_41062:656-991(+)
MKHSSAQEQRGGGRREGGGHDHHRHPIHRALGRHVKKLLHYMRPNMRESDKKSFSEISRSGTSRSVKRFKKLHGDDFSRMERFIRRHKDWFKKLLAILAKRNDDGGGGLAE